jgi:polyhydroxybutyrate depolymerase
VKPGDQDVEVAFAGGTRTVHVHVPSSYDASKPTPVVLDFHGYLSNGPQQDGFAAMSAKAESAGFIAVHPDGTGSSWNAGSCCGDAQAKNVDDVGYVGEILSQLEETACVDDKRVFSTGLSNGGFLSYRLACEMSDRIAAIAPVAGVLGVPTCAPERAVPIMHFHGTSDPLVPYGGNAALGSPSVADTIAKWVALDGCGATPKTTYAKGDVTCQTYDGCAGGAEVVLCTVEGGGHTWPGGSVPSFLGKTTTDIVATDAMWEFFQKHALP